MRETNGTNELPERWSAKRKAEIVLRLLQGEDLGGISRATQVPPTELEAWRRAYLAGAEMGLKKRTGDPAERELVRTRAKLGETMINVWNDSPESNFVELPQFAFGLVTPGIT